MSTLRDLVDDALVTNLDPSITAVLAELVKRGQSLKQIMAFVRRLTRRCDPGAGLLTECACEAAVERLIAAQADAPRAYGKPLCPNCQKAAAAARN